MAKISYFLGANTPGGFYSLMDKLLDPAKARAIYILKGGPGCGKSTLMKKLGAWGEEAGQRVEYIYCSGDPDSLDGVIFPDLAVAIADGTAPHGAVTKRHTKIELRHNCTHYNQITALDWYIGLVVGGTALGGS